MQGIPLLFLVLLSTKMIWCQNNMYTDFHNQNMHTGVLWQGDTAHFIINNARQLQLNQTVADTSIIWTQIPDAALDTFCIQFWLRENFSPSSLNNSRFYFLSDSAQFQNAQNAYYLQFGESGSLDAIRLFQRVNGIDYLLASSQLGNIANAFAADMKLLITDSSIAIFAQFSSSSAYELQLQISTSILFWKPYAGFLMQYTATNATAFYLDDLYFGKVLNSLNQQVIFTEIMADPDTLFGLPATEYLEIFNTSEELIQLKGMKIQDGNGFCTLPSYWLAPFTYVILVASNKSTGFNMENIIEVPSFPNLNNSGEFLALKNKSNELMDQLVYNKDWYPATFLSYKAISLERKSLLDPCSNKDNWSASVAVLGGTPGGQNSILDVQPDSIAPVLKSALVLDAHYLSLVFSEPMDSLSLVNSAVQIFPANGLFDKQILNFQNCVDGAQMLLYFNDTILPSTPYQITFTATDCWNNSAALAGIFIRYQSPEKGDVLINEILFDPPNAGQDFVELFNHSDKYLDLTHCAIHNGQDSVFLSPLKMAPKQYLALCPDTQFLIQYYPQTIHENLRQTELPYFYNDSGTCVLFNAIDIIDSLHYSAQWHFPLLFDQEGFSLERIRFDAATQDAENWFTAAQNSGGATPGRSNSQQSTVVFNGSIHLTYPELSPDLDAYHDQLEIVYEMKEPGLIACVDIYTLGGQLLQTLLFNELIGTKGICYWDGSTKYGALAAPGIYVLYFRAFSTKPGVFFEKKILFSVCFKA